MSVRRDDIDRSAPGPLLLSAEYRIMIDQVCAFLGGEREDLLERLRRQMLEAAQQLNFERAAWLRDAVRSVDEVLIGQKFITGAVEGKVERYQPGRWRVLFQAHWVCAR